MTVLPKQNAWKVHTMLAGVSLLYGINYNIMKLVTPHHLLPYTLILVRVGGAAILFGLLHRLFIKEKIRQGRDYLRLAEGALLGVAGSQLFYAKGLTLTTAINAAVIMTLVPVCVLIASVFLLKERIGFSKWLGIFLGGIGAFLLIGGKNFNLTSQSALGDLIMLGNAVFFGIYLVRIKPLMVRYHPITVTKWIFLFGFILVLPFGLPGLYEISYPLPKSIWYSLGFIVIGATFLSYLLNISALKKARPSLVSFYIYFQPLVATAVSLFMQTDQLNFVRIFAAMLIFLGVYQVSRR